MAFYDGSGRFIKIVPSEQEKKLINRLVGYEIPGWSELNADFANVLRNTVTAWMTEHGGSPKKIPLFVSTDHHGTQLGNNGPMLFELVGDIINWDNVSAAANLGDTTEGLKPYYLDIFAKIPPEKQINVWGNHEAWGAYDFNSTEPFDNAKVSSEYSVYYPCGRTHGYDRFGNRVIKDAVFKVKYLVISCFEYLNLDNENAHQYNRIGTEAMDFIISNMEENDGYKLVILSHVPLLYGSWRITGCPYDATLAGIDSDPFFAARKTGGSGTIVDSDGVEHIYDFSGCAEDSPFICAINGHVHTDGHAYINDDVLCVSLDRYYPNDIVHFLLIDLENNQINVWKVDNTPQAQNYQIPLTKPAE